MGKLSPRIPRLNTVNNMGTRTWTGYGPHPSLSLVLWPTHTVNGHLCTRLVAIPKELAYLRFRDLCSLWCLLLESQPTKLWAEKWRTDCWWLSGLGKDSMIFRNCVANEQIRSNKLPQWIFTTFLCLGLNGFMAVASFLGGNPIITSWYTDLNKNNLWTNQWKKITLHIIIVILYDNCSPKLFHLIILLDLG